MTTKRWEPLTGDDAKIATLRAKLSIAELRSAGAKSPAARHNEEAVAVEYRRQLRALEVR